MASALRLSAWIPQTPNAVPKCSRVRSMPKPSRPAQGLAAEASWAWFFIHEASWASIGCRDGEAGRHGESRRTCCRRSAKSARISRFSVRSSTFSCHRLLSCCSWTLAHSSKILNYRLSLERRRKADNLVVCGIHLGLGFRA